MKRAYVERWKKKEISRERMNKKYGEMKEEMRREIRGKTLEK